jgi:hypothetical protein
MLNWNGVVQNREINTKSRSYHTQSDNKANIQRKAAQKWVKVVTIFSEVSNVEVAPLQEISSNEAQIILISKIANRNMARNLAEEKNRINNRMNLISNLTQNTDCSNISNHDIFCAAMFNLNLPY